VAPPLVAAYRAKLVVNGKEDAARREFDASKEPWTSVVVVQGRHLPKQDTPDGKQGGEQVRKKAPKPKTSTTLSLTVSFADWLLSKLDRVKFEDNQASMQVAALRENLKEGAVQRIALDAGQGELGLSQKTRKVGLTKPKTSIHVVFDRALPEELKNETLVLLLSPYRDATPPVPAPE
jgi:hypothetical protein